MKLSTDANFYNQQQSYIRSSSLKNFNACKWLYFVNYVLRIPQDSNNNGARMGNVCHSLFECLLKLNRNRSIFNEIIKAGSIKDIKPVAYLVRKLMARNNLPSTDAIFNMIDEMVLVGLRADFFVEGGKVISPEFRFQYDNIKPKYYIIGTMDKIAERGNEIVIDDFKSSKKKYEGDDKDFNIQALLYSLYASKMWPDKKPIVRFIFLQFPDDPIMEIRYNADTLRGFEYYLESMQSQMEGCTQAEAESDLAAYQDIPNDGSFTGKLLCGFAKKPGQLKKDGSVMFACPAKWAFNFYKIKDKNGQFVTSVVNLQDYTLKEGETSELVRYGGCPAFKNKFIST